MNEVIEEKTEPESNQWQPLINAVAPHAAELIKTFLDKNHENNIKKTSLERLIIGLGAFVIAVVGVCSAIAVFMGNYDTAERLLIPLISFAGGLGIGARLSGSSSSNKI